ncbi:hypothetical protein [Sinomonas sp. ASV322]|uniref:hypothetical protein n=1 Tax=Sinomonas sp. ASV322 TaxID=3041920 RepID=UPI0027DB9A8C|nr:hypothetical protein [Sinomonas sp. ASV322]MDQ4502857.1 hypothetical protein [Sinomonas sp. ASV322]
MLTRTMASLGASGLLAAAIAAGAAAPANATTTQTWHSTTVADVIPVTCDGPGANTSFSGTGTSVAHLTVNNAGDSWFTETQEGTVTLTTLWGGVWGTWTGHLQEWFGSEDNRQSSVQHATVNFQGTGVADPSRTLALHGAFTATVNANGVLVVNNLTVTCQ